MRLAGGRDVRLLWDVCRIPDFQGISHGEHTNMLARIFDFLHGAGRVPEDWFARQVKRIDQVEGDIDTLSKRLAYVRTWTYVAQRKGWVEHEDHWREATRAVEDRLSDALHGALTARFVDRRTSVLLKRLKMREGLVAEIDKQGQVTVEGEILGRLEGFRFHQTKATTPDEARTVGQAAAAALRPELHLRADRFYNAPDTEMDFTEQGGLMWGSDAVGKLVRGDDPLKPAIAAFVDDEAGPDVAQKVERRLRHFVDRRVAAGFEPLVAMERDEALTGLARGFAFRMREGFGVVPRAEVAQEVRDLDQETRGQLRRHGVRFGQFTVFLPALLKPAPTRLRLVLWSLWKGLDEFPEAPPPGLVTVPAGEGAPPGYYAMAGYRAAGERAIRLDMLERLADMIRQADTRGGFEATPDMLSITGMTLEQFAALMEGIGYRAERGERPKAHRVAAAGPDGRPDVPAPGPTPSGGDEAAAGGGEGPAVPPTGAGSLTDGEPASDVPAPEVAPEAVAAEARAAKGATAAPADLAVAETLGAAPTEIDARGGAPAEVAGATEDDASPAAPDEAGPDVPADAAAVVEAARPADGPVETEVFFTFSWAPKRQARGPRREGSERARSEGDAQGQRRPRGPRRDGAPAGERKGGHPRGGPGPKADRPAREKGPRTYEARPKRESKVDPDNPFAALAALKDK